MFIAFVILLLKGGDEMKNYNLRIADERLWQRVKAKAAGQGTTIKAVIWSLLKTWLEATEK
jgi:hypothetical protein